MRSRALSAPAFPPRPRLRPRWLPGLLGGGCLRLLAALPAWCPVLADEPFLLPCTDLASRQENVEGDFSGVSAGSSVPFDPAGEECDPEEETLFLPPGASGDAENAEGAEDGAGGDGHGGGHASLSLSRTPSTPLRRIVRHRASHGAWSHVVELRGDSLTRRRLTWEQPRAAGPAWRVTVGDMTDTVLRLWPRGLPRRTLPAGWTPARGTPEAPQPWSTSLPQGLGAGLVHGDGSAYAVRLWNPVTARGDRPWDPAWDLHHEGAGANLPLFRAASDDAPWRLHLHASATRITRSAAPDTSARRFGESGGGAPFSVPPAPRTAMPFGERMLATELRSPARGLVLTAALSENDRAGPAGRGGLLGVVLHTRFGSAARGSRHAGALDLDLTARQRSAGWMSAWDPALTVALLDEHWDELFEGLDGFDASDTAPEPAAEEGPARPAPPAWGAGEVHAGGRWTAPPAGVAIASFPTRLTLEYRRAWHPRAGTARRSVRGTTEWRLEDARFVVTGTQRVSRTQTGARSVYRFAQAETRLRRFPRVRITAWRAWNGTGPLRTGFFLGADPSWNLARATLTLSPGLRTEVKTTAARETWATRASLGLRVRSRPWIFDAAADTPLPPGAGATHGRITLTVTRSVTQ